jgi:hypothetical protein
MPTLTPEFEHFRGNRPYSDPTNFVSFGFEHFRAGVPYSDGYDVPAATTTLEVSVYEQRLVVSEIAGLD